jgi:hypothetical protein
LEEKVGALEAEINETVLLEAARKRQQSINQFTKEHVRLDARFDQSEFKVDEARPSTQVRFKQLFNEPLISRLKRSANPTLPFTNVVQQQVPVSFYRI